MRISEFKERLESINWLFDVGFYVDENESDYIIRDALIVYATVGKKKTLAMNCDLISFVRLKENLKIELFNLLCEFAKTPPEDREGEKRYIIPLPHLVTTDGEQQYLTHKNGFFACRRKKNLRQIWKEEHLVHVPEEYRDFAIEIVEVEEWRQ